MAAFFTSGVPTCSKMEIVAFSVLAERFFYAAFREEVEEDCGKGLRKFGLREQGGVILP